MVVRRACVVFVVVALAATACGRSTESDATSTPRDATVTPSITNNGLASKSAEEIMTAARTAMQNARSVHIKGFIAMGHERIELDLMVGKEAAHGTMTMPFNGKSVDMKIIRLGGDVYAQSKGLMRQVGGAEAVDRLGKRWILIPENFSRRVTSFLSPAKVADIFMTDTPPRKGGTATSVTSGKPIIKLYDGSGGIISVALVGKPYVLRLGSDSGQGNLDFTDYDAPVTVKRPEHPIGMRDVKQA